METCPYARMKKLFCLQAKNDLDRYAPSALPHYHVTTLRSAVLTSSCMKLSPKRSYEKLTHARYQLRHTFVAAQIGGAPGIVALDGVSAVHGSVVVGTRVVRAVCLAALLFLALAVVALHIMGVVDRSVAVGAADGVAVQRILFVISCKTRNARCVEISQTVSIVCGSWRRGQAIILVN